MERSSSHGWTSRLEEDLSTYSGGDDVRINIPENCGNSETTLLRPKKFFSTPTRKKAAIAVGISMLLAIGCLGFAEVFSLTGRGGGPEHPRTERAPKALVLKDSNGPSTDTIIIRDKPHADQLHEETSSTSTTPAIEKTSKKLEQPQVTSHASPNEQDNRQDKQLQTEASSTTTGSVIMTSSSSPVSSGQTSASQPTVNRKPTHKPKALPENAQDEGKFHPVSLLYQMKLVPIVPNGIKVNNLMNFTECQDEFDGKIKKVGWKASLTVNSTVAHLEPGSNSVFVGFGKDKGTAKRIVAQKALMAIYPGQLKYELDEEEAAKIEPFCS